MAPLATAMQRQRRFVADASHELRTPLTLLSTRAQLLERSLRRRSRPPTTSTPSRQALCRRHPPAGRGRRRPAPVGLAGRPAVAGTSRRPRRRRSRGRRGSQRRTRPSRACRSAGRGRPSGRRPRCSARSGPLRRVLDALIDNAVTHTPPGGHVVVRVTAGPPATVQVVDDGTGIDPEVAPRLFDRFAHGPPPAPGGTSGSAWRWSGRSSQAHQGTVDAGPTPGGGATFTVTLPRHQAHPMSTAPARPARRRRAVLPRVNEFAQDTGWLHGAVLGFAQYGVLLFGALLVVGWWYARGAAPAAVAAALWAGAATLVAVAVNQPLVHGFDEARPYTASATPARARPPVGRRLVPVRPRGDGRCRRGRALAGVLAARRAGSRCWRC